MSRIPGRSFASAGPHRLSLETQDRVADGPVSVARPPLVEPDVEAGRIADMDHAVLHPGFGSKQRVAFGRAEQEVFVDAETGRAGVEMRRAWGAAIRVRPTGFSSVGLLQSRIELHTLADGRFELSYREKGRERPIPPERCGSGCAHDRPGVQAPWRRTTVRTVCQVSHRSSFQLARLA